MDEIRESVTDASYVIMVGDKKAGLFVCSVPDEPVGDTDCASYLQELFLLPEFRGRGIARDIFCGFIERQKRDTGFCFVPESESGKYFIRLLKEAGYSYDLYQEDEVRQFCHVHVRR